MLREILLPCVVAAVQLDVAVVPQGSSDASAIPNEAKQSLDDALSPLSMEFLSLSQFACKTHR